MTDINIAHLPFATQRLSSWDHLFWIDSNYVHSMDLVYRFNHSIVRPKQAFNIFFSTHMIRWNLNSLYRPLSSTIFLLLNEPGVWDNFRWVDDFEINTISNYRLTFIFLLIIYKCQVKISIWIRLARVMNSVKRI